ncbi:GNAT family N-acetyltransferase [Candidatus Micrarchaeota archaeon]|nr:GNAT family N-acetyltransferase [Candidatus Micrarchaeota archaeon]
MRKEKQKSIEVSVESASQEDMPTVIHLYNSKKHTADTCGVGPANTYIAETVNGTIAGALSVFTRGGVPIIKNLAVDSEFEGMGVGRQLFEHVIDELKKQGYHYIIVAHKNMNQGFYSKFGFKELNPSEMVLAV